MTFTDILASDLRGREYLDARGLTRLVKIADSEPESHPYCDHCNAQERLATVQRIVANWEPAKTKKRMRSVK
jgi:hypothetical protein